MKIYNLLILVFLMMACNKSEVAKTGDQINGSTQPVCPTPDPVDPPVCEKFVLNKNLKSMAPREKGTESISIYNEILMAQNGSMPSNYIQGSNPFADNESLSKPAIATDLSDCGNLDTFTTIEQRILDCKNLNGDLAQMNGEDFGIGQEGNWKLVSKINQNLVWRDEMTKLIWSAVIPSNNWCQASGNIEHLIVSNNNSNIQVDCRQLGSAVSVCADLEIYLEQKGNLKSINWRLPTRADFMMADLNGLRSIYQYNTDNTYFWLTTTFSTDAAYSWVYGGRYGDLNKRLKSDSSISIRCVGMGN